MLKKITVGVLLTCFASVACPKKVKDLEIDNVLVRGLKGGPNTAAYMVISNKGKVDDKLVRVECDQAKTVELHDHIHEDGVAKMRPVEGIALASGSDVALEKGGKHIMLMDVAKDGFEGKKAITLTLHFEKAGSVDIKAPIKD